MRRSPTRSRLGRWAALALFMSVSAGGCEACRNAKKELDRARRAASEHPDKPTAEQLLRDKLREAAELAARVCGVDRAAGLEVEKAEFVDPLIQLRGQWDVELTAHPIDAEKGGVKLDRVLVCTAAITLVCVAVARAADDTPTEWRLDTIDVREIKTPGAEWKKPEEHHHHHHHDWD
jgi:hypothetical protein